MKSMRLLFTKGLLVLFAGVVFMSCEEASLEIPYYHFSKVTKYEKDSLRTHIAYGDKGLSEYKVYINDIHTYTSSVRHSPGKIYCVIDGVAYDIQLSNTKGGTRAESVRAINEHNGARLYYVEYEYNEQGRLWRARIDGVQDTPVFVHYWYENNSVVIDDVGKEYRVELSTEKNKGYVCNVMDYSNATYTCKYVVNPHLYFLNIYGAPIETLPSGRDVEYDSNDNLSRVGNYYYEY